MEAFYRHQTRFLSRFGIKVDGAVPMVETEITLSLELAADFSDLTEAKSGKRQQQALVERRWTQGGIRGLGESEKRSSAPASGSGRRCSGLSLSAAVVPYNTSSASPSKRTWAVCLVMLPLTRNVDPACHVLENESRTSAGSGIP